MPTRKQQNEILRLQSEITNEISRDAPAIAEMVFGSARDQPDMVNVDNDRLDAVYRAAYEREDRQWLQGEARRDPEQFLKVVQRIGVRVPQVAPGVPPPSAPGAFARAAAAPPPPQAALPAAPPPVAQIVPPVVAPSPPIPVPPPAVPPRPVILGPNGQPLT